MKIDYSKWLWPANLILLISHAIIIYQHLVYIFPASTLIYYFSFNFISIAAALLILNIWLLPTHFKRGKYLEFLILTITLVVITGIIRKELFDLKDINTYLKIFPSIVGQYFFFFSTTIFFFIISILFWLIKEWLVKTETENYFISASKEAELKFLKAQVNPHFLFNTLNNIYAYTQMDSDKAGFMILSLAETMRYLLNASHLKEVHLSEEKKAIEKLLELNSVTLQKDSNVGISWDIQEDKMIPPLILIPFYENAYKHSNIGICKRSFIESHLICKSDRLHFEIKNSYDLNSKKDSSYGIGIDNVRKRLEIQFPYKHQFSVDDTNGTFKVILIIDFL